MFVAVRKIIMSTVDFSPVISLWTSLICDCSASVFHSGTYAILTTANIVNRILSSSTTAMTADAANSDFDKLLMTFPKLLLILSFITGHCMILK